ncbi:MAG: amino acid ABC transporter ATP-binding protein [Nocardioidaceae bacterium]
MALLRLDGVRKHFGAHHVLTGIDLEVDEQQVVCLIGVSGSGKSTLLRCVNLLETVDDGTIWLDGRDISDPRVDADDVRREVGIVFQAYNLFPHLSVLANLTLGPRRSMKVARSDAEARGLALLERFGLSEKARAYPDSLSGGQQQRVAVIRAVAMAPRLLLLDEITSALDPLLVAEVLAVIAELKRDGMTIVMATHEMDFARQVGDRIVFLDGGAVVEDGPPSEVLTAPRDPRTATFLARYLSQGGSGDR